MKIKIHAAFLLATFLPGLLGGAAAWGAAAKAPDPAAYRKEIEKWRQERVDGLKREDGWLTLVGLYWLKRGANRFGSDPGLPVILPKGKAPDIAGNLALQLNPDPAKTTVTLTVQPGVHLTADGKPVTGPTVLKTDASGKPTILQLGSLEFYLIQRQEKTGVRIKDKESPLRAGFKGLDNYPIQPRWRVVARFEPYKDKKVAIANIVGQVSQEISPGAVVFDWQGKTYRIDALEGGKDGSLFLVFGDQTNGRETYGAGRFLDTDPPKDGKVVVDFNTAYNPPCAFTAFATCPLPPSQNKLAVKVEAGEKKFAAGPEHH